MNKIIIVVAIFLAAFLFVPSLTQAVWVEPSCNPNDPAGPEMCNVEAPVNVSDVGQEKAGSLTIVNNWFKASYAVLGGETVDATYGIKSAGSFAGGYFKNDASTGLVTLGIDGVGVHAEGVDTAGQFINLTNPAANAFLGYQDSSNKLYGVKAQGVAYGVYGESTENGGYFKATGTGATGVAGFGTQTGGEFYNNNKSTSARAAYEDINGLFFGIYAYGANYGAHLYGDDYGVYSESLDTAGYFSGENFGVNSHSDNVAGYFDGDNYGIVSESENMAGRFLVKHDSATGIGVETSGLGSNGIEVETTGSSSNAIETVTHTNYSYGLAVYSDATQYGRGIDVDVRGDSAMGIESMVRGENSTAIYGEARMPNTEFDFAGKFRGDVMIDETDGGEQGFLIMYAPNLLSDYKCLRVKHNILGTELKWQWANYDGLLFPGSCPDSRSALWKDML